MSNALTCLAIQQAEIVEQNAGSTSNDVWAYCQEMFIRTAGKVNVEMSSITMPVDGSTAIEAGIPGADSATRLATIPLSSIGGNIALCMSDISYAGAILTLQSNNWKQLTQCKLSVIPYTAGSVGSGLQLAFKQDFIITPVGDVNEASQVFVLPKVPISAISISGNLSAATATTRNARKFTLTTWPGGAVPTQNFQGVVFALTGLPPTADIAVTINALMASQQTADTIGKMYGVWAR